jgi:hypothetical protein
MTHTSLYRRLALSLATAALAAAVAGTAWCEDKIQLLPLEPVPEAIAPAGEQAPKPPPKRIQFKARGRVDRIAADEIVISDTLRILSGNVHYYSFTGESISKNAIVPGSMVGYTLDQSSRVQEIYLLEK